MHYGNCTSVAVVNYYEHAPVSVLPMRKSKTGRMKKERDLGVEEPELGCRLNAPKFEICNWKLTNVVQQ